MAKDIFLFIDLNSYFAACEQQANPSLRGKPLGIYEHTGGIVLAASREAKKLGIKTGTPTWEAKRLCPEILLRPVDPTKIRALTSRFYRIAEEYSDDVEHVSVDEVSINLTGICFSEADAVKIAREIKGKMRQEMGEFVTGSIGIAESRLLAKIGTNLEKPDGLVLITDEEVEGVKCFSKEGLYDTLDLIDIPGIGPRLKKSLSLRGIDTLRKLAATNMHTLYDIYGVSGIWLHDLSHFRDAWRDVDLDDRGVKSIGHQYALGKKKALYSRAKVLGLLWKLTEKVTARLRKQELFASRVSVYFAYATGGSIGGSRKTDDLFDDSPAVVKVADPWIDDLEYRRGISFMAITVSGLYAGGRQGILFPNEQAKTEIAPAIDEINARYGDFSIFYAPTIGAFDMAGDTVGFGRTRERIDWQEE